MMKEVEFVKMNNLPETIQDLIKKYHYKIIEATLEVTTDESFKKDVKELILNCICGSLISTLALVMLQNGIQLTDKLIDDVPMILRSVMINAEEE